jgi:DNA-binding MarR family transcriptional regulator
MRAHASILAKLWLLCVRLRRATSSKSPSKSKHTAAQRITPEQQDTWFALLFTHASVTDRIDRDLQEQHHISFSATEILCRLHDEEPQSVRALADRLVSVSPTRASRLVQELAEADKLRHALAALGPWERSAPKPKPAETKPVAKRPARKKAASKAKPARARARAASASGGGTTARTAPGQTRAKVLAALSSDAAHTASEVAELSALARPTVSTTLSRLAKSGEVVKADRGYRLPSSNVNATVDTDASTS